jgi:hypothetical protein
MTIFEAWDIVYPLVTGNHLQTREMGEEMRNITERQAEAIQLVRAALTVFIEMVENCVPIPDKDSVYVTKITMDTARNIYKGEKQNGRS